jgi:hypothetical protein
MGSNSAFHDAEETGGVEFVNCTVVDDCARPFMLIDSKIPAVNISYNGVVHVTSSTYCRPEMMASPTPSISVHPTCVATSTPDKACSLKADDSLGGLEWLTWYTFTGRSFVSSIRAVDDVHTSLFLERNLSHLRPDFPSVYSLTEDRRLWNETAMKENKARRKDPPGSPLPELSALPSHWLVHIDAVARAMLANGGVQGVMLGDELVCRGVPQSNLTSVTIELRKRLPHKIWLWANECESIHRFGNWWSPALDVVSVDLYSYETGNQTGKMLGVAEASHVKQYYEQYLFPLLGPHQKVAVVPGLFADSLEQHHHNRTAQDTMLCNKLAAYQLWAKSEPRIVGMAPFHWDTFGDVNASTPAVYRRGAEGFPKLLQQVAQLRRTMLHDENWPPTAAGRAPPPPPRASE